MFKEFSFNKFSFIDLSFSINLIKVKLGIVTTNHNAAWDI